MRLPLCVKDLPERERRVAIKAHCVVVERQAKTPTVRPSQLAELIRTHVPDERATVIIAHRRSFTPHVLRVWSLNGLIVIRAYAASIVVLRVCRVSSPHILTHTHTCSQMCANARVRSLNN